MVQNEIYSNTGMVTAIYIHTIVGVLSSRLFKSHYANILLRHYALNWITQFIRIRGPYISLGSCSRKGCGQAEFALSA